MSKQILLCATGMTPQVVTETLYALCVQRDPPWIPDEVHVITTSEGARDARLRLFGTSGTSGKFREFLHDYGLGDAGIAFTPDHIEVMKRRDGTPLADIRSADDNAEAAEAIGEFVRRFCVDGTQIHASAAGGRKTMGISMGFAMTLFGRLDDALSHVLVSDPFEGHPNFFYPKPQRAADALIEGRDGRPLDARHAKIDLALMPFAPYGLGFEEAVRDRGGGYASTMEWLRRRLAAPTSLEIRSDMRGLEIRCGGEIPELEPLAACFYAFLARRRKDGEPGVLRQAIDRTGNERHADAEAFLEFHWKFLEGTPPDLFAVEGRPVLTAGYVDPIISRINRTIRNQLGPAAAAPYLVQTVESRTPDSRSALAGLEPEKIKIELRE